jgi:hypothetical protein
MGCADGNSELIAHMVGTMVLIRLAKVAMIAFTKVYMMGQPIRAPRLPLNPFSAAGVLGALEWKFGSPFP